MTSTNSLTCTLTQLDKDNVGVLSRILGPITFPGTSGELAQGIVVGTSPVSLALPTSPALQVLIRNTHAANSLTVTWTPAGGSSAVVQVLAPGGLVAVWAPVSATGAGVTAISLTGSAAGTTAEVFLGG